MQSGPSDSSATSNASPGSSNASSGSSNASSGGSAGSPPSLNEASSDVNISSAADDSSSLDPLSVGLTASLENSATSTKLFADSIKARALPFARPLSKRADFTCTYHCLPEIFDEHLADPVGLARYKGRDLLHGQQWPLLRQREVRRCSPICRVSAQASKPQTADADAANENGRNGNFHEPDGTVGNINTGDYTLADGRPGNLYNGPRPELSNDSTSTVAVSESAGESTPTASVSEAAGESALASASKAVGESTPAFTSELTAPTATTAQDEALTSQATATENGRSGSASPTSNTRPTTSSTLQPASSVSGATTSSTSAPGNAASGLRLPNRTMAAAMSIIIGCLLWQTTLF